MTRTEAIWTRRYARLNVKSRWPSLDMEGAEELWERTTGDQRVLVAVLDGAVDLTHQAFEGAHVDPLAGLWHAEGVDGRQAAHGTHVASVLFGQHGGPVPGMAPGCRGLTVPVFSDQRSTSQLDLARGIDAAVEAGAHVISVSGGQLSPSGEAEDLLARAVRLCQDRKVLLAAAAGNDGCLCQHVPAALPSVLAVGAMDDTGRPLESSNWGDAYQDQGILAPGQDVLGARPGGGTTRATGTSMATPIVAGVAALLLSLQRQFGLEPDPLVVRDVLLDTADPCESTEPEVCQRLLGGKLNIRRAVNAVTTIAAEAARLSEASCACAQTPAPPAAVESPTVEVVASQTEPAPPEWVPLVYAVGTLGYDFGSEARRDTFKQLMAPVSADGTTVPANPYDSRQMVGHLTANPSEASVLIWTLNLELTPIYALEAVGPYAGSVYELLVRLLAGEVAAEDAADYIERVSLPGRLSGRTVRLFSGQVVPVVELEQNRGIYGWEVNTLVANAIAAARARPGDQDEAVLRTSLREFLTRVYYDLRNLGTTSPDRALNFAATNAFQAAQTFADAIARGMALDSIGVEKSPFCRRDSDCWDVKLRFFDPENSRRAKRVFRFTLDVSDLLPVTLGDVRVWSEGPRPETHPEVR